MDPDPRALVRRRSTVSSSAYSTSSSSPEVHHDSVITPDSEDDGFSVAPKLEDVDEDQPVDAEDAKPHVNEDGTPVPVPRKRGRPRKHPAAEQKKSTHVRSKTGCWTCRRRKKKCDETKPSCMNCEKNNVVCDGYEPRQPWRGGKQKSISLRPGGIPGELPLLIEGIDSNTVDKLFLNHFVDRTAKVLSLTDHANPFLDMIVPMAFKHVGLMHSLLYLSGTCLVAQAPAPNWEWEERQQHHSSRAIQLLHEDIGKSNADEHGNWEPISDPTIAQTLILCLQTVCAGDTEGRYRLHLDAMKTMLTRSSRQLPNEDLRLFILEFLLYHDYSSAITSGDDPIDSRSSFLMSGFQLPEYMIQPQAGALLGVMDGLFGYISRIRKLRDDIRLLRRQGNTHWWESRPIVDECFAIDGALRGWECVHAPESPRWLASLLYRQCTWIYLQRTVKPSEPSEVLKVAVDQGLAYMRALQDIGEGSMESIMLMPLFLLGAAAFDPGQRPEIDAAFQRLQDWSQFGNIRHAREIVAQIWGMMDEGREEETWDWETIIEGRGWKFLVT